MGTAIIKMKMMPGSPASNLQKIEQDAKEIIKKESKSEIKSETQPVAFGLSALFLTFTWDEDKSTENLEKELNGIEDISSAEIVDLRRALG
jgi:translation elongation factor aEF-1 beta